ncbi:MAG: prepilin-type N-terminal cleavage/methylation domain-containing protein [Proteobacteria bacterium]|nr:prepilin-type N-terminal cleavage/methylation domain-containing protein [Pseudomonadota bacterium]
MKVVNSNNRGFSLVEILVVLAMLGIVLGAIFSLYIAHLKNAYVQDETIEMQQNLRMAMESITSTLKNAGTLVPLTTTPLAAGIFGNWTSSVTINTASSDGIYARATKTKTRTTVYAMYSSAVDSSSGFANGDRVRLIKPLTDTPVFATYTTLIVSGIPASQSLSVNGSGAFAVGDGDVANGDMFAKAASLTAHGPFDIVQFYLVTGGSCPANQTCLARSTNGSEDIIASYISKLRFSYVYEDGTEDSVPPSSSPNTIRAVRVTLDGTAATSSGPKNKQLTSLIMLRNKR